MAAASSIINKVAQFARSPKGQQALRQVTARAQQMARDPKTRAKVEQLRGRFINRGGRPTH
ncbi:hypothetical protein [Blastococcus sp. SYSU D00820]